MAAKYVTTYSDGCFEEWDTEREAIDALVGLSGAAYKLVGVSEVVTHSVFTKEEQ